MCIRDRVRCMQRTKARPDGQARRRNEPMEPHFVLPPRRGPAGSGDWPKRLRAASPAWRPFSSGSAWPGLVSLCSVRLPVGRPVPPRTTPVPDGQPGCRAGNIRLEHGIRFASQILRGLPGRTRPAVSSFRLFIQLGLGSLILPALSIHGLRAAPLWAGCNRPITAPHPVGSFRRPRPPPLPTSGCTSAVSIILRRWSSGAKPGGGEFRENVFEVRPGI